MARHKVATATPLPLSTKRQQSGTSTSQAGQKLEARVGIRQKFQPLSVILAPFYGLGKHYPAVRNHYAFTSDWCLFWCRFRANPEAHTLALSGA